MQYTGTCKWPYYSMGNGATKQKGASGHDFTINESKNFDTVEETQALANSLLLSGEVMFRGRLRRKGACGVDNSC